MPPGAPEGDAADRLALADWRRRIADLSVEVRSIAAVDPPRAWRRWRDERERLFRDHPQSPVPASERQGFTARHWPYDPGLRFELAVVAEDAPAPGAEGPADPFVLSLPISTGGEQAFSRIGFLDVPFREGPRRLGLYWMHGYSGGLFLPFRDATNGTETYGAGRYALDGAKSADLGGDAAAGTVIVDFNFAYHPSCAFDPKWSCPLAPPENRLDLRIEAGERLR